LLVAGRAASHGVNTSPLRPTVALNLLPQLSAARHHHGGGHRQGHERGSRRSRGARGPHHVSAPHGGRGPKQLAAVGGHDTCCGGRVRGVVVDDRVKVGLPAGRVRQCSGSSLRACVCNTSRGRQRNAHSSHVVVAAGAGRRQSQPGRRGNPLCDQQRRAPGKRKALVVVEVRVANAKAKGPGI
jgi:hypothetical protein